MLKYLIFSGGTGSEALQEGLAEVYGIDRYLVDVVINAYDNGKSTGACRRIFKNKILGPSDARKNQTLRYYIRNKNAIVSNPLGDEAQIYNLFEMRITENSPLEYYTHARKIMEEYKKFFSESVWEKLVSYLDYFFFAEDDLKINLRNEVLNESFSNFSIANIFYSSCAALHNNSLQKAMDEMADILGIGDTVHLISDKNLFLKAETESGNIIQDEGDIVDWNNSNDKIIRVVLTADDNEYLPKVGECLDASIHNIQALINEADIILFSSGTQWSSLIPTYMHRGFREAIHNSKAKKYLIMNNIEDKDSIGVSAADFCRILDDYLDINELTIVLNNKAVESMRMVPSNYNYIVGALGKPNSKTHDPVELIKCIMTDYYKKELGCSKQFFDLDGTLWNEKGDDFEKEVGFENLKLFHGDILSGNSYEHVRDVLTKVKRNHVVAYVDYGNTFFSTDKPEFTDEITHEYDIDESVCAKIKDMPDYDGKAITLRGGVVITIKPFDNQNEQAQNINLFLRKSSLPLIAKKAGRSSVDITHISYTKAGMLKKIIDYNNINTKNVVFIGNELNDGSEKEIADMLIVSLHVNDVYECNNYLRTRALMETSNFL